MSLSDKTVSYICRHCPCSLTGKTVLITGGNSGIGFKTAETMLFLGASVILACRNAEKAEAARQKLLADYPAGDIRVMLLDLADFRSIDAFVDRLPDVDVFINNAGLFHHPHQKTADGFELVMGTNYIGVHYLSERVLPIFRQCGHEVVYLNTVSIIHKVARVNYSRFFADRNAYSRSKLCLARYTAHLAEQYAGTNIRVYMIHPGLAVTPIASHICGGMYTLAKLLPINSAEKSSLAAVWLLSHDVPVGSVVGPSHIFGGWGYPGINRPCRRALCGVEPLIAFTKEQEDAVLH